jgi:hypothetical protein
MPIRLRKFALTAHVAFSVGWLGAVAAYLALAIVGVTNNDEHTVASLYLAMEVIGWCAIVPLSLGTLLSGLVQSLGTEWGLIRYFWILEKFVLTIGATTILLLHMPTVARMSGVMPEVIHAGGGLLVLLTATALSIYKPWGRTPWGWPTKGVSIEGNAAALPAASSNWGKSVLFITTGLFVLVIVVHLVGIAHSSHGGH